MSERALLETFKEGYLTDTNIETITWTVLFELDWETSHSPVGLTVTAGMECMLGSATYFMSTGTSL